MPKIEREFALSLKCIQNKWQLIIVVFIFPAPYNAGVNSNEEGESSREGAT